MSDLAVQTMARRLDRLERENRHARLAAVALVALLAAVFAFGQSTADPAPPAKPGKIVAAQQFIVHDARGGVRAELGTLPDGTVRLVLYDRGYRDEKRIVLGVGPKRPPALTFTETNGKVLWSAPSVDPAAEH
jgi:hypothetical protein